MHTLSSKILLSNSQVRHFGGEKPAWTTNNKKILLFSYDVKHLFRHSYLARYKLYNLELNSSIEVRLPDQKESAQIQVLSLSPDGQKIAFVQENNIFIMDDYSKNLPKTIQITKDGELGTIFNGITDWLYEEEILYQPSAMFWSPKSRFLAFIKFNDSNVDYYTFPLYDGSKYNTLSQIRYPKTGGQNPIVKMFVHDTKQQETKEFQVPEGLSDYYIYNVKWIDDSVVMVVYVNRKQTKTFYCIYNPLTGKITFHKSYPLSDDSWIAPSSSGLDIVTSRRYQHFFQIWAIDGYKAIIKFNLNSLTPTTFTNHNFDVIEISYLNEETGYMYYTATAGDSRAKHLFRKHVESDPSINSECLSCEHELENKKICLYNSPHFHGKSDLYILDCLGEDIPVTYVKSIHKRSFYHILENNTELRLQIASKLLPKKEYKKIYLDNNTLASTYAELLLPPTLNKNNTVETYPVLTMVYNGPGSQMVDFQFRVRKFESFFCTTFKTIVAIMDGRGTDNNGDKFMKSVYRRLGEYETIDQITLAKELKKEIFTDDSKFAIYGWSYGGYIAAMTLFQDLEYRCAISGAPVVDWSFYDTAYTERYLGLYEENRYTYEIKSNLSYIAISNIDNFDDKKFLLIHGTGDDNVHFQNSAVLAKILRHSRMDFQFEVYPDVKHSPDDEETQRHLHQKMTKFLMNCYNISPDKYTGFYPPRPVIELPPKPDEDSKS